MFTRPVRFMITAHLDAVTKDSEPMQEALTKAIQAFNAGDWGKVPQEDKEANNEDLKNRDGHVLARYETPEGDIYINLEFHDEEPHDYALLMFCNEY